MSLHGKRKEIYKYEAPWTVYAMNWSVRPDKRFRLALGSFVEEYNNKVGSGGHRDWGRAGVDPPHPGVGVGGGRLPALSWTPGAVQSRQVPPEVQALDQVQARLLASPELMGHCGAAVGRALGAAGFGITLLQGFS